MRTYGKKEWLIADCYYDSKWNGQVSHEAVCVLNTSEKEAHISFTLFFEDREPITESRHQDHTMPRTEISANNPTTMDKLGTMENTRLDFMTLCRSSFVIPNSRHREYAFFRWISEKITM